MKNSVAINQQWENDKWRTVMPVHFVDQLGTTAFYCALTKREIYDIIDHYPSKKLPPNKDQNITLLLKALLHRQNPITGQLNVSNVALSKKVRCSVQTITRAFHDIERLWPNFIDRRHYKEFDRTKRRQIVILWRSFLEPALHDIIEDSKSQMFISKTKKIEEIARFEKYLSLISNDITELLTMSM